MKYNFDEVIDRRNTDAVKTDFNQIVFGSEDVLPLWVADMDFRTPDFVLDAMKARLEHPVLGYSRAPKQFIPVIRQWVHNLHQWDVRNEWLGFVPGIVPALSFAVQCFTVPGDEIIVQSPVYFPFFHVVNRNNRVLVNNPLVEVDGRYEMDFDDLERKITDNTRMLILCNPHNPGGRVWSLETLRRLDEICTKNHLIVISDEIHADMALPGFKHIPYATVSESAAALSVTFMAPSKVFNMPGLISSYFIIPSEILRKEFKDFQEASELNTGNVMAYHATIACYEKGDPWRRQMLEYVQGNIDYVDSFLKQNVPQVKAMLPDASFLLWLDCKGLGFDDTDALSQFFVHKARLGLNKGTIFGEGGEQHMRLNVACPRSVLEEAMNRLKKAVDER